MKRILIITGSVLVVLALAFGVYMLVWGGKSSEEKLTNYMIELGELFYQEYYEELRDNQTETEDELLELLASFEENGLQVNLDSLSRIDMERTDEIEDLFKNCSKGNTYVIVRPISPFAIDNFSIDVTLDCE